MEQYQRCGGTRHYYVPLDELPSKPFCCNDFPDKVRVRERCISNQGGSIIAICKKLTDPSAREEQWHVCINPLDTNDRVCQYQGIHNRLPRLHDEDVPKEQWEAVTYALQYVANVKYAKIAQLRGNLCGVTTTTVLAEPPRYRKAAVDVQSPPGAAAAGQRHTGCRIARVPRSHKDEVCAGL